MNWHICIIVTACMLATPVTSAMAQADTHATQSLEGVVRIGALVPITGDASLHGQDIRATLELAESEINQYLQERDAGWEMQLIVEDSATSPVIALEKLAAIKARGVDLVVGTYSSAELRNVMGYATSNNMLLVAYASTAPSLAVPDDNIFRFIPDATKQAPANARLFSDMGITHVIPMWRGDAWGDDLVKATKDRFESLGRTFHDGIRYNPEAVEFSTEVALLSDKVEGLAEETSRDKIGILLLTFSEGVHISQSARQYENLKDLAWVGSDTLLNVGGPRSDPISSEFFDSQISITVFAPPDNPVHDRVASHVFETVGREPIVYSLTAYESAWALGLAVHAADSTDPKIVASALPDILDERSGVFGKITLNDAGDLDTSTYEILQLRGNEWVHVGTYDSESDGIAWSLALEENADTLDVGSADSQSEGGCLIATATFGSELAPQVQFLREIRDDTLLQTSVGHAFMERFNAFYYLFSPAIADIEREHHEIRDIIRVAITPALYILGLMSVADPDSEISVIVLGTASILAMAGVYIAVPILATRAVRAKLCRC